MQGLAPTQQVSFSWVEPAEVTREGSERLLRSDKAIVAACRKWSLVIGLPALAFNLWLEWHSVWYVALALVTLNTTFPCLQKALVQEHLNRKVTFTLDSQGARRLISTHSGAQTCSWKRVTSFVITDHEAIAGLRTLTLFSRQKKPVAQFHFSPNDVDESALAAFVQKQIEARHPHQNAA